jgi:PAS domain S-box-containing protein
MARRPFIRAAVAAGGILAVIAAVLLSDAFTPETHRLVSNATFPLVALFAAASCARAAMRSAGEVRRGWAFVGAAMASWTVGLMFWFYYQEIAASQPFPGPADVFIVGGVPLAIAGLLSFPAVSAASGVARARVLLDALVTGCALLFVSWALVLEPIHDAAIDDPITRLTVLAYPAADVVLATVALLMTVRARPGHRPALGLVATGLVMYAAADSAFAYQSLRGVFTIGTPLDLAWIGGYLLVALAPLVPGATDPARSDASASALNALATSMLAYVALAVMVTADMLADVRVVDDPVLTGAGLAALALFGCRQWLTLKENLGLRRSLEDRVRRRTAELARLEKRHRSILDAAGEGIYGLDIDGRIVFANPAAGAALGYTVEELLGEDSHALFHHRLPDGGAYPRTECPMLRALEAGTLHSGEDEWFVRRDGTSFPIAFTAASVHEDGERIGVVVVFRDITERRAVERMKDEFVSVVSHELRTPLTSIRGSLGLLESGTVDTSLARGRRMVEIAVQNTDRLIRLINDILDLERMESGETVLRLEAVDLRRLVAETVAAMESMAAGAGVRLDTSRVRGQAWADADRVQQVLANLLSNALKFSPAGGTVSVEAAPDGAEVVCRVRDEGPGIPASHLETVFGRFQQVDATSSRRKGGTGLGLAICRSIVEHHGGRIWAESAEGEGTTMVFALPAPRTVDDVEGKAGRPTALVCDDDPAIVEVATSVLGGRGWRVVTATSGAEALERAQADPPDVVVLDLLMPSVDGWDVVARLKAHDATRDVPVVVLSVLAHTDEARPDVEAWIEKPFDPERLMAALEAAAVGDERPLVLVIEDDLDLAGVLATMFSQHGYATAHAATGAAAVELARRLTPALVVLDLGLPRGDGFSVVDLLREEGRLDDVPLVVYTAAEID